MGLPNHENLTFTLPRFHPITHPLVYHFWKKSNWFAQIWCFCTIICSKHTQFLNLLSFIADENPQITISNFVKKHLTRQAHKHLYSPCHYESTPSPHSQGIHWILDILSDVGYRENVTTWFDNYSLKWKDKIVYKIYHKFTNAQRLEASDFEGRFFCCCFSFCFVFCFCFILFLFLIFSLFCFVFSENIIQSQIY